MKKIFLIAASAMMVLASCTKVVINYPEDAQPQEIAMFAVNKSATKAPVNTSSFPTNYEMKVAAYLASGAQDNSGFTAGGDYFDGTLFTKVEGENIWTGGKYWPVSTSTINFLAVAMQPSSTSPYTGTVDKVVFGEKVGNATNNSNFTKQAVVTFANNQTTENNYNQFDLMYAAGQGTHDEGESYDNDNVTMTFKHALSWIKFTVATNVTGTLKVNSIRLSKASYGGTMTISNTNFDSTDPTKVETGDYTVVWTDPTSADNVYVPGAEANSASELNVNTTQTSFGNGLLVVPVDYSNVADNSRPTITINYTMNQGGGDYKFERTIEIPQINWVANKIYTYALTITLQKIEIDPSVTSWDINDSDANTNGNQDIPVDAQ